VLRVVREHRACRFAPDEKSAEAAHAPAAFKLLDAGIEHAFAHECAGIEDGQRGCAEIRGDGREELRNGGLVRRVTGISTRISAEFIEQ